MLNDFIKSHRVADMSPVQLAASLQEGYVRKYFANISSSVSPRIRSPFTEDGYFITKTASMTVPDYSWGLLAAYSPHLDRYSLPTIYFKTPTDIYALTLMGGAAPFLRIPPESLSIFLESRLAFYDTLQYFSLRDGIFPTLRTAELRSCVE